MNILAIYICKDFHSLIHVRLCNSRSTLFRLHLSFLHCMYAFTDIFTPIKMQMANINKTVDRNVINLNILQYQFLNICLIIQRWLKLSFGNEGFPNSNFRYNICNFLYCMQRTNPRCVKIWLKSDFFLKISLVAHCFCATRQGKDINTRPWPPYLLVLFPTTDRGM